MKNSTKFLLLSTIAGIMLTNLNANAQSCTGSATINITINQPPTASISNGASVVIPSGGSATLTANVVSGATYEWYRGATLVSSGLNQNTLSVTQAGSYTVEIINASGCSGVSGATVVSIQAGVNIPFKLFLEGPFNGTAMTTTLASVAGTLPTAQPYNAVPWNYAGTETITSTPTNMVDWVLIQAVDPTTYALVASRAAILLADGTIQDPSGATGATFSGLTNGSSYHFIIRHRNHLDVMTRLPLTVSASMSTYDFTTAASQAFGNGQLKLSSGKYVMYGGDYNGDGVITVKDYNRYVTESSQFGYKAADGNMNRTVEVNDFNLYQPNSSTIGTPQIRLVVP